MIVPDPVPPAPHSARQLLRSTVLAMVIAALILVTIVLPAEYGVDPTRLGGVLGLTEMGKIKRQLAAGDAVIRPLSAWRRHRHAK